uniref:Uncharacterized protein n=1 Tax=Peronospora matthiolae TaxID=2874970 RepID=A0AAV1TX95_9STRA
MLMGAPVSWGSKKQSSVSLSTSGAEYIALSLAIQGRQVGASLLAMRDFGGRKTNQDRTSSSVKTTSRASKMTKNPVNHGRAKHIDIKYHHIRDEVKRSEVQLEYCETSVMMAVIMTKGLSGPRHKDLTTALGNRASSD